MASSYRFTNTDKWTSDTWFRNRPPKAKILWWFLTENCKPTGFIEFNVKDMFLHFEMDKDEVLEALYWLRKKIEFPEVINKLSTNNQHSFVDYFKKKIDDPDYSLNIWIINYLKHQNNIPLSMNANVHISLLNQLKKIAHKFKKDSELWKIEIVEKGKEKKKIDFKTFFEKTATTDFMGYTIPCKNSSSNNNKNSKNNISNISNTISQVMDSKLNIIKEILVNKVGEHEAVLILKENKNLKQELIEKNIETILDNNFTIDQKKGLLIDSLKKNYEITSLQSNTEKFKPNKDQIKYGDWILRVMEFALDAKEQKIKESTYKLLPEKEQKRFYDKNKNGYHWLIPPGENNLPAYTRKANYNRKITEDVKKRILK